MIRVGMRAAVWHAGRDSGIRVYVVRVGAATAHVRIGDQRFTVPLADLRDACHETEAEDGLRYRAAADRLIVECVRAQIGTRDARALLADLRRAYGITEP